MEVFQIKSVIPGEQVAREAQGFMPGWGTYADAGIIYSSVAGTVQTISKLITVVPQKSPYKPEIGDVVIGRVCNVDKKSWRLDIKAQRDATLMLTAINLPQGEQRRRSEQDQMMMRSFFQENDLVSGEIQALHKDGSVAIQTRNLKYGKLKNGILLEVKQVLIKKMKYHFIDLMDDVKMILGMNGLIWIYYSTIKLEQEYFSEDLSKIENANKNEVFPILYKKINENSAIYMILFRNLIQILDKYYIDIDKSTILKVYEIYSAYIDSFKSPNLKYTDLLKKKLMIETSVEKDIVNKIKQFLESDTKKSSLEISNVIKNLNKIIHENDNEMDEDN